MSITAIQPLITEPSQLEESSEVVLTINDGLRIRDVQFQVFRSIKDQLRSEFSRTFYGKHIEVISLGLCLACVGYTFFSLIFLTGLIENSAVGLIVGLGTGAPLALLSFTNLLLSGQIIDCIFARMASNRVIDSLDELVSPDLLYRLIHFLNQKEISILNSQQFMNLIQTNWLAVKNLLTENKLTEPQAELVRKINILKKMNSEQILEVFSNDPFIEDVKSNPMLFEAFQHFITESYHGSARITANIQLLEQSLNEPRNLIPVHQVDPITEEEDDTPLLEPIAACSSQTEETQQDRLVTLIFSDVSCSEPLSETWLKSKCKYFSAFFREKKVILHIDETKENFTLLLRALHEGASFVNLERLNTLLQLATKYFADEVILYCTLFAAENIQKIDMTALSQEQLVRLDWDQDSVLQLQKHKLYINHTLVKQIFRSRKPLLLMEKIHLFSECFNIKGIYENIQNAILMCFDLNLTFGKEITIQDFARYLLVVDLLIEIYRVHCKEKIIKLLNVQLSHSICGFWIYAASRNNLPLKIAIAKFCLSEEGKSSLPKLQEHNLWLSTRELQQLVDGCN